jgi:outer membrane protein assembly factor BamD
MKKHVLTLALLSVLSACASSPEKTEIIGQPDQLYFDGKQALHAKKYAKAVNIFEELDRQHPYSKYSKKGQVMSIFAQFENEDYDEAIFSADRFIQTNIAYKDLDYVYYIKALAYYNRISDIKRDQSYTIKALQAFQELINRYPDSKYAKDAEQKILLCYNHLAGKEMEVGRFYQAQGSFSAAINRFQVVVNQYQRSSQTPEALYRIAESYTALGLDKEAVRALSILGYNYSGDSIWYRKGYDLLTNIDNYEEKYKNEDWFNRFSEGIKQVFNHN